MNIVELYNSVGNKLKKRDKNNPTTLDINFNDKSDTVTGMLTSIGIFPTARTMLNGHLHSISQYSI